MSLAVLKDEKPLKVSELVARLKSDIEKNNKFIKVIGEVSSFKQWRSGHCYFDIKDEAVSLPAVIFGPHYSRLGFLVTDGQQMIFSGKASIYQASSRLQMIVENMEPLGQGALALAFLKLKEKLKTEGLFDEIHKKPIKPYNFCVGIITSSHGAVLRDMVRILKSRMPKVEILFFSVRVQGPSSALEIKEALELLDSFALDVIIVGRGGGSLEDLAAFNDELLARAIFKAKTPIISAVGHETDFTICDFVADLRAATPTHAATLAVPKISDLILDINNSSQTLLLKEKAFLQQASLALELEKRKLKDPRILLFRYWQDLDEKSKALNDKLKRLLVFNKEQLDRSKSKLETFSPYMKLRIKREALYSARSRLERANPKYQLEKTRIYFVNLLEKLHALSPLKVLARGYSLIEDQGKILSKKEEFHIGQAVNIRIADGLIKAQITSKE
jgi:exodeoxyribonuclease VII large subunit